VKPTFVSLIFLLSASSWAFAQPQLENVIVSHTSDEFVSELVFDQPVKDDQVSVEFINKTIQVDIPGLKIPEGKRLNRVNHSKVKSVFTYQASNRTLRTRIIYKPSEQNAERYEGFVQVAADGNRLKISVTDPEIGMSTQLPEKEIPVIPPTDLEKGHEAIQLKSSKELSPEEIVAKEIGALSAPADEKQENDSGSDSSKGKLQSENKMAKNAARDAEENVPLFKASAAKSPSKAESPWMRILMSLSIITVVGVGMIFFGKWWSKRYKRNEMGTKIQVLTQHHIGPKKSLTIVRVAGESILLGVTENNISMIKTLSLIDDEVPERVPERFTEALSGASSEDMLIEAGQREDSVRLSKGSYKDDDFSYGKIENLISDKLQKMRQI
jgi:flagellar protein FliO/FliZ